MKHVDLNRAIQQLKEQQARLVRRCKAERALFELLDLIPPSPAPLQPLSLLVRQLAAKTSSELRREASFAVRMAQGLCDTVILQTLRQRKNSGTKGAR